MEFGYIELCYMELKLDGFYMKGFCWRVCLPYFFFRLFILCLLGIPLHVNFRGSFLWFIFNFKDEENKNLFSIYRKCLNFIITLENCAMRAWSYVICLNIGFDYNAEVNSSVTYNGSMFLNVEWKNLKFVPLAVFS